ncbi:MAG TPA: TIGR03560 family F420-dependent LLM class oxidoreductase [Actinomycetota bacterium]|nr:TIGR03560 family F420-dependent LLM class oxidoreductase [Actinomycetota bacterium]
MDVCLMIEGQEGVTWPQWVDLARACEAHGFAGLFRSDHYLAFDDPTRRGSLDAWTTLAALAPLTERIRLGSMVSPATFRHPSLLAKSVVTVDHASGGRAELGMGAGWFQREHAAFGFPFASDRERVDVLAEQVEIVHRLWDRSEGEVTFAGHHYRLDACTALPRPVQEPHPPLILGGGAGARVAALAARWADEYDVVSETPEAARAARDRLSRACEAIDRDPDSLRLSMMTGFAIGADPHDLHRRTRRLMDVLGETGDPAVFLDGWRADRLVGTVDEVLERLAVYAGAGVRRVMLQHLAHEDLETVAMLGERVVPAAAAL